MFEKECHECDSLCSTCKSPLYCTSCIDGYVRSSTQSEFICQPYENVTHCTQSQDSKCTECSHGYKPSEDGLTCNKKSYLGMIIGIVFGVLAIVIIIVFVVVIVAYMYYSKKKRDEKEKNICVFKMKRSNVKFLHSLNEVISCNKEILRFDFDNDELLPVNEETRDLICIGNTGKNELKSK